LVLAVVHDAKLAADRAFWRPLEDAFRAAAGRTSVTLIVHDVKFLNHEIRVGQYFFADVVNEGVALYDGRHFTLARPKALNQAERLALGEQNFADWFASASEFIRGARYYAGRGQLSHAAFLLHQAAERYYHSAALVLTGDKDRSHDLEQLSQQAAEQHPHLAGALPRAEPDDERLFLLLKKAYIDARYSPSYRLTPDEFAALQARVLGLAARVREVCLEKLATFGGPDAVRTNLPVAPTLDEPLAANLPPPPSEPSELGRWAAQIAELGETRAREGEAKGRREGEARGQAEGLREGKATALRTVLAARGFEVDAAVRARVEACADLARLDRWLTRARTAASTPEALDDEAS
jgi:uncharacterized protein